MKGEIIEVSSIAVKAVLRNRVAIKMPVALGHAVDPKLNSFPLLFINFISLLDLVKMNKSIPSYRKHLIGFADEGINKKKLFE